MIWLCHDIRSLHTIYDTPEMPDMEVPEMDIIPPYVVQFNKSVTSKNTEDINTAWVQKITSTLVNIDGGL